MYPYIFGHVCKANQHKVYSPHTCARKPIWGNELQTPIVYHNQRLWQDVRERDEIEGLAGACFLNAELFQKRLLRGVWRWGWRRRAHFGQMYAGAEVTT